MRCWRACSRILLAFTLPKGDLTTSRARPLGSEIARVLNSRQRLLIADRGMPTQRRLLTLHD
jgi:hypothetical protein